jgi:hypothetical protein
VLLWSSGQSSWLQIQRSGFHSRRYQIFCEVVGLQRGPFSLVSTPEELLGRKSSGSGLENGEYASGDPLSWPRDTFHPQRLALTSPTSCGRSIGIVRSRTKATAFFALFCLYVHSSYRPLWSYKLRQRILYYIRVRKFIILKPYFPSMSYLFTRIVKCFDHFPSQKQDYKFTMSVCLCPYNPFQIFTVTKLRTNWLLVYLLPSTCIFDRCLSVFSLFQTKIRGNTEATRKQIMYTTSQIYTVQQDAALWYEHYSL